MSRASIVHRPTHNLRSAVLDEAFVDFDTMVTSPLRWSPRQFAIAYLTTAYRADQRNQRQLAAAVRHGRAHAGRRAAGHAARRTCHSRGISPLGDRPHHVVLLRGISRRHAHRTAIAAPGRTHPCVCRACRRGVGGGADPRHLRQSPGMGRDAPAFGGVLRGHLRGCGKLAQRSREQGKPRTIVGDLHAGVVRGARGCTISAGLVESAVPPRRSCWFRC